MRPELPLHLVNPSAGRRSWTSADARAPTAEVLLAAPRGFCAGVRRAIDAVRDALRIHGPPIYVRHAIVHNETVVRELEGEGAVFVECLADVPRGEVVIFSAHGVSPDVAREASLRGLRAYDAVCPLVAKVHREVERHHRSGRHIVVIGHADHAEIVGTLGRLPPGSVSLVNSPEEVRRLSHEPGRPLAYAVQTTYSVREAAAIIGALKARFSDLAGPPSSDICYATTNRQAAAREIASRADAVIVAGSRPSSNANRLVEVALESCAAVQLAGGASELDWGGLPQDGGRIGLTAAASTPESVVAEILEALGQRYRLTIDELRSAHETTAFRRVDVGS